MIRRWIFNAILALLALVALTGFLRVLWATAPIVTWALIGWVPYTVEALDALQSIAAGIIACLAVAEAVWLVEEADRS